MSDDEPIIVSIDSRQDKSEGQSQLNYRSADWNKFREIVTNEVVDRGIIKPKDGIDRAVNHHTEVIHGSMNASISKTHTPIQLNKLPYKPFCLYLKLKTIEVKNYLES